jgi:peptidoglycan/xylan/chitin deacetylase (PgdA/CDA1 family)
MIRRPPVILAYHGLARVARTDDPTSLMVPPEEFVAHVRRLKRLGYRFVHQRELARRLTAGESLAGLCSLTFDDGSVDNVEVLPGLLDELDVPATVFVCPGLLGRPYPWLPGHLGIRLMDRDELLTVAANPRFEIGSHTNEHMLLGDATEEEAYAEMRSSRERLEDLLGREVVSFAYPKGLYSPACPPAARRAGYTSAVTTGMRGHWRPFALQRESPDALDGPVTFYLKVGGVFRRVRDRAVVRLVRDVTRPVRHRAARASSAAAQHDARLAPAPRRYPAPNRLGDPR